MDAVSDSGSEATTGAAASVSEAASPSCVAGEGCEVMGDRSMWVLRTESSFEEMLEWVGSWSSTRDTESGVVDEDTSNGWAAGAEPEIEFRSNVGDDGGEKAWRRSTAAELIQRRSGERWKRVRREEDRVAVDGLDEEEAEEALFEALTSLEPAEGPIIRCVDSWGELLLLDGSGKESCASWSRTCYIIEGSSAEKLAKASIWISEFNLFKVFISRAPQRMQICKSKLKGYSTRTLCSISQWNVQI